MEAIPPQCSIGINFKEPTSPQEGTGSHLKNQVQSEGNWFIDGIPILEELIPQDLVAKET